MHFNPSARRHALHCAVIVLVAACAGDAGDTARVIDPRCDGRELPAIAPGGIGPARLGLRVATLAELCRITDTTFVIAEGLAERGHLVHFGDHRVIAVSTGTPDTSITRVIVTDSAFRTPQGIGVGSSIAEVRKLYPVLSYTTAELRTFTLPSLPGIGFAYEGENLPEDPSKVTARQPEAMDAGRVNSLWVFEPIG